jgi:Ulp1 family protease
VPVSGSYRARDYWFDDLIINQYMILLSKRDAVKNPQGRKNYFVDPLASNQFMEWMRTGCQTSLTSLKTRFQSIRHRRSTSAPGDSVLTRWMPVESISELDHIFIPIKTQDAHFVLGFIDLVHEATYVFDSLGSNRPALAYQLYSLMRELLGMDEERWQRTDWSWTTTNLGCVPIQPNSCDCGLYVCLMSSVLALNQGLHHIRRDAANDYRLRMAHEILNNETR